MDKSIASYDIVWKQTVERYIVDFSLLFLGEAWLGTPVPESLDAELARCSRGGRIGGYRVDKLLRAVGPDGAPCLWHIEIQVARQRNFAERMLVCHYRLYDHFQLPVRSIAILGDPSPSWRPQRCDLGAGRTQFALAFETVKLRDFEDRLAELLLSDNIVAWLVVAHLLTLRTRREPINRMLVKNSLLTGLRACGWEKQKYLDAVDLIDRMMTVSKTLQDEIDRQQNVLEEGEKMAWKYLFEERAEERGMQRGMARGEELGREVGIRLGRELGREEGRLNATRQLLRAQLVQRFGQLDDEVLRRVEGASLAEVEKWCLAVVTARTIDEIF